MEQTVVANPMSRRSIRQQAFLLRKSVGLENSLYFPIIQFIELVLPKINPEFSLIIYDNVEMANMYGLTFPEKNAIYLREDVYNGTINEVGRDRFTVAHELGHYLFHQPANVGHARLLPGSKIKPYCNPEWQADAFAGELLIPMYLIHGMSIPEITGSCGVSYQAAGRAVR